MKELSHLNEAQKYLLKTHTESVHDGIKQDSATYVIIKHQERIFFKTRKICS